MDKWKPIIFIGNTLSFKGFDARCLKGEWGMGYGFNIWISQSL